MIRGKEVIVAKMDGVQRATGRSREQWFALLDRWGAAGRPFREISDHLTGEHDLSKWWAQKLIIEYEQARGIRAPQVRPNGTFEVGASKTIAVPVERLFDAFVDTRRRKRWLTDGQMSLSDSKPGRFARFDWEDGVTRVSVGFTDKGPSKSAVSVAHDRITNARVAQSTKTRWRERLVDLKNYLES